MRKTIKKIGLIVLILLLLLVIVVFFVAKTSWGQRQSLSFITSQISQDLGVEVSFDDVEINFFSDFVLTGFYIEDQHGDTLAYVEEIHGDIKSIDRANKIIVFEKLFLKEPLFDLHREQGDSTDNIQFILERYFSNQHQDNKPKWKMTTNAVEVENGIFKRNNYNKEKKPKFDVSHINLGNINAEITDIEINGGRTSMNIQRLNFRDDRGFVLDTLSTEISISDKEMNFKKLAIMTPNSNLLIDGKFNYPKGKYLEGFQDNVDIVGNLEEGSVLSTKDLGYFLTGLENTGEQMKVSGKITGKIKRLKGKELDIRFGDRSQFKGNMSFDGLPDVQNAFVKFKVKELSTDYYDLLSLDIPLLGNFFNALPPSMSRLKQMRFKGSFSGFLHDFVAYGSLKTALGSIQSNVAVIRNKRDEQYRLRGQISTEVFDLKSYLADDRWGNISANLQLDAVGKDFKKLAADVEGSISQVQYNGYSYENLQINGLLDEKLFTGELHGEEPNLGFDFLGTINFVERIPLFDFNLSINHANPVALQLSKLSELTSFSADIATSMRGNNLDNIQGYSLIRNLRIITETDSVRLDSVLFNATTLKDGVRELKLQSDELEVNISGNYKMKTILPGVLSLMQDIMPSWYKNQHSVSSTFNLKGDIQFKKTDDIFKLFMPELGISEGSSLTVLLNPSEKQFEIGGHSDSIHWKGVDLLDLKITAERYSDRAYVMFENRETVLSDKLSFEDNVYTAYMYNDSLESDLTWSTNGLSSSGFFSTLTVFDELQSGVVHFMPSDLIINDEYWSIKEEYPMRFDGKEIDIPNFELVNGEEKLKLNGLLSLDPERLLDIQFENFKLSHLNEFVKSEKFSIAGTVNMESSINNVYGRPAVQSLLAIDSIVLMGRSLGDLTANSTWQSGKKTLNVDGKLIKEGVEVLHLDGLYDPTLDENKLDATLSVNELNLDILEMINAKGISNYGGQASGKLHVGGQFTDPDVKGKLYLDKAQIKIDFLNTTYVFSDTVIVEKDWMGIDNTPVVDELGNIGYISGTVGHEGYKQWNYDFYTTFDNLLCFNLEKGMNSQFYGTAFAGGTAAIGGFGSNVFIEVDAHSNKGTIINIPLGDEGDVKLENFISFVSKEPEVKEVTQVKFSGLDMMLNLDINRDAFIRLIFDEQIGDVIEGRGHGLISMDMDNRGVFSMYGNYTIEEGNYLFTLKNIVNKRFEVEKGGTIKWFGDPFEALIDIDAIYKVRTSLADFSASDPQIPSRNVLVLCKMNLKNRLLKPDLGFEIDIPNVSPNVRGIVMNKVNSELELNRQFFSLLVLNKFLPDQSATGESTFSAVDAGVNTGVEFLANQLSNLLSQISTNVDVGVQYRPGDPITNEELAVALSTQLFNERLIITGNLGVSEGNGVAGNSTALIGDFILEYMLTKEGQLRLKVFNETNDFNITNPDQTGTTQGVGIILYRDIDPLID